MAGILKNQILKHLSKFVKNLSSDKISLSTLKGEGELSNLELDEEVLTELLALPSWMKLTHAKCNKAKIRIQWTKLKSVPIVLALDEVIISVEACEELRTQGAGASSLNSSLAGASGKYGFVNKVIDGITATVNSVEITFHSKAFESKVEISRIKVESQSPQWKKVDLQGTRLKCMQRGETLVFKAMDWQTLRLEARSTSDRNLAPLRLLTNQAKARIVIKKKLSDCQVLGCRLSLILDDDLLLVLTDSQILAALHFMNSLSGLIKQATELTQRYKAARKLESLPEYQAQLSQTTPVNRVAPTDSSRIFDVFDVKETSYHLLCQKIDLHLCDDPGSGRSTHDDLKEGGALQLLLMQTMIDVYPYHLASGDRRSWPKYSDNALSQWLTQSLSSFRIALIDAVSSDSMHSPLTRTQNHVPSSSSMSDCSPIKKAVTEQLGKLMSTCLILKVQDLRLYKVTTSSKRDAPEPFLSSYIDRPKDLQTIHCECTWFYYPGEVCFPLPSPKVYAHMYPFQVYLDMCTIIWISAFVSNLQNAMSLASLGDSTEPDYVDVRVELIMPKVVFENKQVYPSQKERPNSIQFQASRVVLSNYRSSETGSLHQLAQCLELLQRGDLAYGIDFPAAEHDIPLIPEKFILHTEGRDKIRNSTKINCSSFQDIASHLTKDMMKTEPRDVWYVYLDPFWSEFCRSETKRKRNPSESSKHRRLREETPDTSSSTLYPFIDSVPISAWIYLNEQENPKEVSSNNNKKKSIRAIFNVDGICNIQLSHYQYLFMMRMVEAFSEMSLYLTHDLEQIIGQSVYENLVTFIGYVPRVELNLLFPQLLPGKQESSPSIELDESSGMIPESSSGENDDNQREDGWKLGSELRSEQEPKDNPFSFTSENLDILAATPTTTVCVSYSPVNNSSASLTDSIRTSISQVKHGVSNLAVTFNKVGGISTPDSEVASNWSNMSSNSGSENNFITLDDEFNAGPTVDGAVEVACEALLEDTRSTPSPSFSVGNHVARAENDHLVNVLTVVLNNVEAAQENKGLASTLKVQCRSLSLMECPGVPWNEFQAKFAARNRNWDNQVTSNLGSPTQKRVIKMRLSQLVHIDRFENRLNSEEAKRIITNLKPRINLTDRPGTESPIRQAIIDATDAFLDARIDLQNEDLVTLHMSTIVGLTDFVEDEIYPSPFPMELEVIGATVELLEDRPPMNITSPGPVPVKLSIPNLLPISRDKHGVFQIGKVSNVHAQGSRSDHDVMLADFEKIQRQLELMQRRNSELERELLDTQNLKLMILQLQTDVSKLQEEKSNLLNRLRS